MKFIRVLKAYNKPSENNPFGFVNLYHSDIFDDNQTYNIDDSLLDEILDNGILNLDEVPLLRKNLIDSQISGSFLNDNFEENKLKELKQFLTRI